MMKYELLLLAPLLLVANPATPAPAKSAERLKFRCDSMEISRAPNRVYCRNNVVARQGSLILCCNGFEGTADDNWEWTNFVCKRDVRAQQQDGRVWASHARYQLSRESVTLSGKPFIQQGKSSMTGSQVTIHIDREQLRVKNPKGVVANQPLPPMTVQMATDSLPNRCPIPARPVIARRK